MYQFGFSYVIKETKSEIQIQKSFMNSQPIVNGSNLSWILAFVTENPHFFFSIEKRGEVFMYCGFWDTIQSYGSNTKKEGFLLGKGLGKTGFKMQVQ